MRCSGDALDRSPHILVGRESSSSLQNERDFKWGENDSKWTALSILIGITLQLARRALSSSSLSLHEPFPLSPVLIVRRVKFVHARFVQPVRHRDAEYRDDPQRSRGKSKGLFDDFARVAVKLHELVGFDRRRVGSASSSRHSSFFFFLSLSLSLSLWGDTRASFFYRNKREFKEGKRWVK